MKLGVCSSFVGGVFLFGWGGGMDLLFYIGGAFFFMGNGMFMTGVRGTLSRVIEKRFLFFYIFLLFYYYYYYYYYYS